MFERLEQKDPDHFAVRQYKKFLLSAGKTRSSIMISCGARLAPFDIRDVYKRQMLIAFLENNLREDGSVAIPKPLQPYMGGMTEIRKK